jgi:hypothetical protein
MIQPTWRWAALDDCHGYLINSRRRANMAYDRLTASNATVLLIDHQTGLANGVPPGVQ